MRDLLDNIHNNVNDMNARKKAKEKKYIEEDLPAEVERLRKEVALQGKRDKLEGEKRKLLDLKNRKSKRINDEMFNFGEGLP